MTSKTSIDSIVEAAKKRAEAKCRSLVEQASTEITSGLDSGMGSLEAAVNGCLKGVKEMARETLRTSRRSK